MKRELTLILKIRDNHVARILIKLPRINTTKLLSKHTIIEGQRLLPSLFSVCAQAQGAAAWGALVCSGGNSDDLKEHEMMHTVAVQIESIQENLRSLTFSLPDTLRDMAMMGHFAKTWRESTQFLGRLQQAMQQDEFIFPDSFRALLGAWDDFCEAYIFGVHSEQWLKKMEALQTFSDLAPTPVLQWVRGIAQEMPELGRMITEPLPLESYRRGTMRWEHLISQPFEAGTWLRINQEPGMAFVIDRFGNSAASRIVGRLVDVARTLTMLFGDYDAEPWIKTYRSDGDFCVAEVQCARGVLLHRAKVENNHIVSYNVCAPTDWNLHKNGALSTLIGVAAANRDRLYRHATWLVQSLDPCVAFSIEMDEEK
ncbi:MAG: hypothetical protein LBS40_05940 [Burkholderiales bacterium]|nr:hypothetical protein [Burkholderiales bacterium]